MHRMRSFLSEHKTLVIIFVLLILGGAWFFYPKKAVSPYETASATVSDLIQDVTVTGKVQSESSVDLAFERSGRILEVGALVGETVVRGATLLRIDGSDIEASLTQALANVSFEEARLAEILRGARPEEIRVSEVQLENSTASLQDLGASLRQTIADGYTKMDDSVRNKTDKLFRNPRTSSPELDIPISDFTLSVDIVALRKEAESELVAWDKELVILSASNDSELGTSVSDAKRYLSTAKIYLEKLSLAVNGLTPTSATTQTTIDSWKSDISIARTTIGTALNTLISSENAWRGAKSAVALAEQQLALKRSGSTEEELAQQKAKIASVKASAQSLRAQLSKFRLIAPIGGTVTKQDGKRGAIAQAGLTIVSIQSTGSFKIEANIPEVDIAKITLQNSAKITLDAYGEDIIFNGIVTQIDPSERVIDGVPTYKVTLRFDDKEGKVRSGMTANVQIETNKKIGALSIPARAVLDKNGKKIVRILPQDQIPVEREVVIGLRSSDGRVEILKGVSAGESVITFDNTKK